MEKGRDKYVLVKLRGEDAKYLDEIKEKILFIVCGNKERCKEMYSKRLTKSNILGTLLMMVFLNDDLVLDLAKRLVIDEVVYNAIMEKIKEREEYKKKKEEEESQKQQSKQPKVIKVVEECKDPPEVCAERRKREHEEWRRQVFDLLGIDESEVS
jgi:hypothetical protein